MTVNAFYGLCVIAMYLPFLAILLILCHYFALRFRWRVFRRGFCPSALALGMAFQFMQIFHRPSTEYVLEAKQEEDADEDDNGDPDFPQKHLNRQLKKIRRGEHLERLEVRL
jgi:hypothetical protein